MPGRMEGKGETGGAAADGADIFTRHWKLWVLIFWIAAAAFLIHDRWNAIRWFALADTDDNLRMMQVRALLAGQDWFDLRQYRLDPPFGADVHWSRLVDLPLAGLLLVLKPIFGGRLAEQIAVAVAPLIPMGLAMAAVAVTARRLIAPKAFALAIALLLCAHSARGMWSPTRIDHHGWQLALLSLVVVALADRRGARGGVLMGLASALSLAIGLEMLIYLAAAGAVAALLWIRDGSRAPRFAAYGASLAGGSALGYLLFASNANRAPVCDALSPVWLSAMAAAGALAVALALMPLRTRMARFGAAAVAGLLLAGGFALAWPHCLGRLEGVSPELHRMWLGNVREALPLYRHSLQTAAAVAALPVMGLIGYGVMLWRLRRDPDELARWGSVALLALLASALLLWQSRAGPAAQLLGVPGATALAWLLIPLIRERTNMLVRVTGTVVLFLLVSGILPQQISRLLEEPKSKTMKAVNRANAKCPTLYALRPIAKQPKGYVLTFVDLGPRLIAVTHHNAVAGPYHRNERAILDVMRAFRGSADTAQTTVMRRGIDYVLICPGMSESTIYRARAPKGFYVQLAKGQVPGWLSPIELPEDSPFKMWRVVRR